jgi:aminopeptidase N
MQYRFAVVLLLSFFSAGTIFAQPGAPPADTSWKKVYRGTDAIINDLVHTKIDARFDIPKAYMYGKVWITLKPHFYATDSLRLDAKGMEIKKVALQKGTAQTPLKYDYSDQYNLRIMLDKTYKAGEKYMVYIEYTAKPDELKVEGGNAITDAKGLYFVNKDGAEPDKPTQIWTQGETEATSVWCPTIDRTNQKTTQETYMTVPGNWVTLSNGKMVSSKKNADGTRTDYWNMDLPHTPYLFFMGAGDFAVVKDTYKGKEVNYYVDKEYESVARKIFGNTPEMMAYFSKITGVDYPWAKYGQMVAHDYVSGAMENTTATLHQESAQQDARELLDQNGWESTIAHELFHQWFGDYVTCESWSNLTVNESFANYSQMLWDEYKYGKDAGDAENFANMQQYLSNPADAQKHLVRFYYENPDAMFDLVSYQKGGRVLHMLRNYVGDSAFFKGLNNYLVTNKFKTGEAHQLRLALEEVSGRDLNWFFNQWYFGGGHPKLDIDYRYTDNNVTVVVKQTQSGKAFRLPFAIDIYKGGSRARHNVWMENAIDSFTFVTNGRPDLVNVDGDKILLCTKKENNKTLENYIHQYQYAGKYPDRREAIDFAGNSRDPKAIELLKKAVNDPYHGLRILALDKLKKTMKDPALNSGMEQLILNKARTDEKTLVKAKAIDLLSDLNAAANMSLFETAAKEASYAVSGAALDALYKADADKGYQLSKTLASNAGGRLGNVMGKIIMKEAKESDFELIADRFAKMPPSQQKFGFLGAFCSYLGKLSNMAQIKRGIDLVIAFKKIIPEQARSFTDPEFASQFKKLSAAKGKEIEDYIAEQQK